MFVWVNMRVGGHVYVRAYMRVDVGVCEWMCMYVGKTFVLKELSFGG